MQRRGDGVDSGAREKHVGEHHNGSFGIYMSHKIQKLRKQNETFASTASPRARAACRKRTEIFRDVHVYVDGYTVPSKEELRQLLLLHGGGFEHYDTNRVTHVLATHLPASKLRQLQKAKKPLPVVHPDWIVQSIQQNKLLPVQPFLYAGLSDPTQRSVFSLSASEDKDKDNATAIAPIESASQSAEDDDESDVPDNQPALSYRRTFNPSRTFSPSRTHSSRDGPDFVQHFFATSRLHHIGSWRATFQQKAEAFQAKYTGPPMPRASPLSTDRVILHVDMDCFFVAVALRGKPELATQPVAVAHSQHAGTSEISSCNYVARAKGVAAGMLMHAAKATCPNLIVLPYYFDAIERVSCQIYDIFFSHTMYVQATSCDEALLEFDSQVNGWTKARIIRNAIFEQTGCTASVGISYNILLAKLASKKAKPNGMYHIADPRQAQAFVSGLPVRDLPGVGRHTEAKLAAVGITNVHALAQWPKPELIQLLGQSSGKRLYDQARGIDVRPVSQKTNTLRKSVSAVVNFGIRFQNELEATSFVRTLGHELCHRLQKLHVQTQCLTLVLKLRAKNAPVEPAKFMGHGACDTVSKSCRVAQATNDQEVISTTCITLFRQLHVASHEIRGVGVQATKLMPVSRRCAQQGGQGLTAWRTDCAHDTALSASPLANRDRGIHATHLETKPAVAIPSYSQLDQDVLDELPDALQREIRASYGRKSLLQATRPALVTRRARGKNTLGRRKVQSARNIFSSKSNDQLAQPLYCHQGAQGDDAWTELRLSQVDADVYYALPLTLQREIERHAIKRRRTSVVALLKRPKQASVAQTIDKTQKTSSSLPSIEVLFANLVTHLQPTTLATDQSRLSTTRSPAAAFDAIYARVFIEVETRALDKALRMLRFLRRKSSTAAPAALAARLKHGFNHVLNLVNNEIQRTFQGVLSSQYVSPL